MSASFRVALISMPWALFNRPSIQLGALKSSLEQDTTIQVDTFHPYLQMAKQIGLDTYHAISKNSWAGEALFSSLLFPEMHQKAAHLFNKSFPGPAAKRPDFDTTRATLAETLESWLGDFQPQHYDLIGFSLCFSQLLSSLTAARRIKKEHPDIPIVFGGSSCVGRSGRGILHHFPEVDYIVDGEGEPPLHNLCHVLRGECSDLHPRIMSRNTEAQANIADTPLDLNDLPVPDYSSYFTEMARHFPGQPFIPLLPLEFSRGCWWNKCTFCNLNLQWHSYRWKNEQKVLAEIEHLAAQHRCLDFTFTDNALPQREADAFFATMASGTKDYEFFAEIRLITDAKKLQSYRRGGLTAVQVGIEALSTSLLHRMRKGTTTIDNIAAMKASQENDILLDGNLITEFPGSTREEVEETLASLDCVLPYRPLSAATFFLGYGSPVHSHPEEYHISHITPHPHYRSLLPKAYLADTQMIVNGYRGDRTQQRKLWRPVRTKLQQWQAFHKQRQGKNLPPLSYRDGTKFIIIRQEQHNGPTLRHRLVGMSRALYLFCGTIKSLPELLEAFPSLPQEKLLPFFDDLAAKRLLYREGQRFLALALHDTPKNTP